jgi:uncharacterized protein YkwD
MSESPAHRGVRMGREWGDMGNGVAVDASNYVRSPACDSRYLAGGHMWVPPG